MPNDPVLIAEVQEQHVPYHQMSQAFNLNQIKLIIETSNGNAGIIASTASVGTCLLWLRDWSASRVRGGCSGRASVIGTH